jgi:hypothetical protein
MSELPTDKLIDHLLAADIREGATGVTAIQFGDGGFLAVADSWAAKLRAKHGQAGAQAHFDQVIGKFGPTVQKANASQPRDGRSGRFRGRYQNELELKAEEPDAHAAADEERKSLALPWRMVPTPGIRIW